MNKTLLTLGTLYVSFLGFSQLSTVLNINATDMLYDKSRNKIFAVVSSADPIYANKLIQIDCATKTVEKSVFIGSDPALIDITSDNEQLYIALSGTPKIVRVGISSFTSNKEFQIGPIDASTNIFAKSIATIPGKPDLLAVSRMENDNVKDVALFKDGVVLTNTVPAATVRLTEIEVDSTGTVIYGYNNADASYDFGRLAIGTDGLTYSDKFTGIMNVAGVKMNYSKGLIYSNKGNVINANPSIPYSEGTYGGVEVNSEVAIKRDKNKIYFARFDYVSDSLRVRKYNMETFGLEQAKLFDFDKILPSTVLDAKLDDFIALDEDKFVMTAFESFFPQANERYIVFYEAPFVVGVNESIENQLAIFPNPTNDKLNIHGLNTSTSQVELINTNGKVLSTSTVYTNWMEMDLSPLEAGVYFVRVSDVNGSVVKKITKN